VYGGARGTPGALRGCQLQRPSAEYLEVGMRFQIQSGAVMIPICNVLRAHARVYVCVCVCVCVGERVQSPRDSLKIMRVKNGVTYDK